MDCRLLFKNTIGIFLVFNSLLLQFRVECTNPNTYNDDDVEDSGTSKFNQGDQVSIGVLLPKDPKYQFASSRVMPAIELAVFTLTQKGIIPRPFFKFRYVDSQCDSQQAPIQAIDLKEIGAVDAFLGPVCDVALAPVAYFVSDWNLPIVTPGGLSDIFDYKSEMLKTLTRIGPTFQSMTQVIERLFEHFLWGKAHILFESGDIPDNVPSFCFQAAKALIDGPHQEITGETFTFSKLDPETKNYGHTLRNDIGDDIGVVIICASPETTREVMLMAYDLAFDNGKYVFLNIDFVNSNTRPWYSAEDTRERNTKARKAYEALLTVTVRVPTSQTYKAFSSEVKKRAAGMSRDVQFSEKEVNSYVGAFHDAVILYAMAINETLEANGSIRDGQRISRRMWNRTFEGITGTVTIDANGDRSIDYSLLDMNPRTGKFEVVANYIGAKKEFELIPGKPIHWPSHTARPTPDTPPCGFDGSNCPPDAPTTTQIPNEVDDDKDDDDDEDAPFPCVTGNYNCRRADNSRAYINGQLVCCLDQRVIVYATRVTDGKLNSKCQCVYPKVQLTPGKC